MYYFVSTSLKNIPCVLWSPFVPSQPKPFSKVVPTMHDNFAIELLPHEVLSTTLITTHFPALHVYITTSIQLSPTKLASYGCI